METSSIVNRSVSSKRSDLLVTGLEQPVLISNSFTSQLQPGSQNHRSWRIYRLVARWERRFPCCQRFAPLWHSVKLAGL